MLRIVLIVAICCSIGTVIAYAEKRTHRTGQLFAWLLGVLALISIGAFL